MDLGCVRHSIIAVLLCTASAAVVAEIEAQTDLSTQESQLPRGDVLEEVVVTARRTQENIQDVPLSITALSASDLDRESITTAQDLMGKVASLVIGPNSSMRNAESPNIRGQGATFSASPGVVMYWAEVPLPQDSFSNNQGGPGMFFDVQNLQVLKGPQGTLFGRNTTGGAFVIEPVKPQDSFFARLRTEAGNYDSRAYEAILNLPLQSDRVLLRMGGQRVYRDGFTKDVVTGKEYDDRNYWTARLGLTIRLGDSIENNLLAYTTERDETGTGNVIEAMNPEGINGFLSGYLGLPINPNLPPNEQFGCQFFNASAPSTNCGLDIAAEQNARDIRHVELSADPKDQLETGAVVDIFTWKASDSLTVRNIASISYYQRRFNWDQDGSRAALNDVQASDAYSSDTETVTEELQFQGELPQYGLSYVAGAYYEKRDPQSMQENPSTVLFSPIKQSYRISSRSRALYAQASYDLAVLDSKWQGWIVTAGVRRTVDEMEGYSRFDTLVFTNEKDPHDKQYATTWLVSASYQFDDAMVYGKVAQGYKAGGFTGLAANPKNFDYDPEYVRNYELGIKSDLRLADMPLRLNGAIFLSDYTDMQRVAAESYNGAFGAATFNAGESEIRGFEMDFILLATSRLRLMGNYSYTDAEFKEFRVPRESMTPQQDCVRDDVQNGELGDYSCMPFTETPEHQYSLTATYELPLDANIGIVETSLTYSWVDDRFTAPVSVPQAEPGAWLDDYHLVNASINWLNVFGSQLDLQLYATNLTDEEYRIANSNSWNELAFKNSIWSEPRMYGLRLSYRWGEG